jgi:hypothetical protein
MAHRSPGRGSRAWRVESVWVKRREGPERVLIAYRLLLDLPPRRVLGVSGPPGPPPRQERRLATAEGTAEAGARAASDSESF